jgi:Ser/Thr protein kinase RdoA (MazF antagonist)
VHYRINAANSAVDLGGSSSLNLLVTDEKRRYVVRVYRPYVTEARLESIHHIQHALMDAGIPCSTLVTTQTGQSWIRLADRLVEV